MQSQTDLTEGFVEHVIRPDADGLTVEVSEIAEQEEQLLKEFQACQEGRCSCPTEEYKKLESLEISRSAGTRCSATPPVI